MQENKLLEKIKELKMVQDISEVNKLIKGEWILVQITSIQNKTAYLLGRV